MVANNQPDTPLLFNYQTPDLVITPELQAQACNLSIPLYVKRQTSNTKSAANTEQPANLAEAWDNWQTSGREFWLQMDALVETLDGLLT